MKINKQIKIIVIIVLLFTVIGIIALNKIFNDLGNNLNKVTTQMRAKVGVKVVLQNDTLTVVDFSILDNTFKLSNGSKVDAVLIEKIQLKK